MGIQFAPEYGGSGMSAIDYCICIEELARVDPSVSLSVAAHNGLGAAHIGMFGSEEQKQQYPDAARERREARGVGTHRAGVRQRRRRDAHDRHPRRRQLGAERHEDVHHARQVGRHDGRHGGHRQEQGQQRHLRVHRRARHAGLQRRQEGRQARDARQRDDRGDLPELPRAGAASCSARKGRASSRRCRCSTPAASASPRWPSVSGRAPTRRRAATPSSASSSAAPIGTFQSIRWKLVDNADARRGGAAADLSRGVAQGSGPPHDARIVDGQAVCQRVGGARLRGLRADPRRLRLREGLSRPRNSSAT